MAKKTVVKKVLAYPFGGQMTFGAKVIPISVVRIARHGLMAEISDESAASAGALSVSPGDKLVVSFELPVLRRIVQEHVVVIKLYTQFASGQGASGSWAPVDSGGSAPAMSSFGSQAIPDQERGSVQRSSLSKGTVGGALNSIAVDTTEAATGSPDAGSSDGASSEKSKIIYLVEMHFLSLSEDGRKAIGTWLRTLDAHQN